MVFFSKRYQFHQIGTPPPSGQSRHYRLPLVLLHPTSSLRGFFTSLRVSLTHFILFLYERAFRLPTSFPISGLARLRVKPRLCRSSGKLLRPLTRSCFLLLVLGRLFLLALLVLLGICFPSRWSPSFPLQACALIPLFLAKVSALTHLDSLPLMIWCLGQTALFLFLFAKAAPAYLPTALSVALRPLFPFRQAQ